MKSLALPIVFCLLLMATPLLRQYSTAHASYQSASLPTARYSNQFDRYFQSYSDRYLPWKWNWLKAQCYQESLLVTDAVSEAGAVGICQFVRGTWADCQDRLNFVGNRTNARLNIRCSAWYMKTLRRNWDRRNRTEYSKRQLSQASYNAGLGNILEAQEICSDKRDWPEIEPCLVNVTGPINSLETRTYVTRIKRWFCDLEPSECNDIQS